MARRGPAGVAVCLLALVLSTTARAAGEEIKILPTARPGVTQSFLLVPATGAPVASVLLFAGGDGNLNLRPSDGRPQRLGGNFLVRNRDRFAQGNLLVAVVDVPSDHRANGLTGFRTTAEHAEDIKIVIAAVRATAPVPVWLVGTSMGTISAASVAARLRAGGPDGLVLTSSVTRTSRAVTETVVSVNLADIRVPTLVLHHREDTCIVTPWMDAKGLLGDLTNAPRRAFVDLSGGDPPRSEPCEAMSPHGYFGIEDQAVAAIVKFIRTAAPAR